MIYEQNIAYLRGSLEAKHVDVEQTEDSSTKSDNESIEEYEEKTPVPVKEEILEEQEFDEESENVVDTTYEEMENEDTLQSSEEIDGNIERNVEDLKENIMKGPRIIEKEDGTVYEERTKYECKACGDIFLFSSGIVSHMHKKHEIQDINPEDYGKQILVKINKPPKDYFSKSKKQTSKSRPTTKCIICKQIFDTPEELKSHLTIHKTYICEVCGNSFIRKSYLDDHRETHGTDKNYECKFCNKTFKRRTVLVKHKRIHTHPRQCVCEVCGKRFNDNGTLKTHRLLLHIKERKHKCVICNQSFTLKPTLDKHVKRHMKREHGIKDFPCDECDMKYRDKSSLNRHKLAKHSGVTCKVQCEDCGKQYTSSTNLLKHKRTHHSNVSNSSSVIQYKEEIIR